MPDNFNITQGSGTSIAAKDNSGTLHQRILTQFDSGGTPTDVSVANPLPVTLNASGEASYDAMVTVAYSSLNASFTAVTLIDSGSARQVEIWNDTNANIIGSWDGGSTEHFIIPAKSSKVIPFVNNGVEESTDVQIKYQSAPSSGNVYFEVIK